MLNRCSSVEMILPAYNAGLGRVAEHLATGRTLPNETVDCAVNLLSALTLGHDSSALQTSTDLPPDPSTATLFLQVDDDLFTVPEHMTELLSRSGDSVQAQETVPSVF